MLVREQLLLVGLTETLVQHAEFELRHDNVLIVRCNQLRRLLTQYWRQTRNRNLLVQKLQQEFKMKKINKALDKLLYIRRPQHYFH